MTDRPTDSFINHTGLWANGAGPVADPGQGYKDTGWIVDQLLTAANANWLFQQLNEFQKHLDSRAAKGVRFPVWLDDPDPIDGGGLDLDLNTASPQFITAGNEQLKLGATPSITLPDASTNYVWAESDGANPPVAQLQSSVTRADMFDGAPIAIVVTAGAAITSISPCAPLMGDIGKRNEVTVGDAASGAQFTVLSEALTYAEELGNELSTTGSRGVTVRLTGNLSTSETDLTMFSGLDFDLNGCELIHSGTGDLFLVTAAIQDVKIRNGKTFNLTAGAGVFVHFDAGGGAFTVERFFMEKIHMRGDGVSSRFTHLFHSEDVALDTLTIRDCEGSFTTALIEITSEVGNTAVLERVLIERCIARSVDNGAGTVPAITINNSSGGASVNNVWVRGCSIYDSRDDGIELTNCDHSAVESCHLEEWLDARDGIQVNGGNGCAVLSCVIDDTTVGGAHDCISINSTGGAAVGNVIENATSTSLRTTGAGKIIDGNSFGGTAAVIAGTDTTGANAP